MVQKLDDLPTLVAQAGPLSGKRFALQDNLMIGRDESCDIHIPDRQISRYHARLMATPDGILLEDLGSKNGTHRNGHGVFEPVLLSDGDVIQVALIQQFVFMTSDATATMPLDSAETEIAVVPPGHPRRLRLDKRSRRVWVGKEELTPPLSVSQFRLLELLYDREGRVVDRREMAASIWGDADAAEVSEQALDALVRRLRDRLAALDPLHTYIFTVRGHGLRLDNPPM